MADLSWKPVGDIEPGDLVTAFDEDPAPDGKRYWRAAEVTAAWRTIQPAYRIAPSDGRDVAATAGHRWLCADGQWITTSGLRPGHQLRTVFPAPAACLAGDAAEQARFLATVRPARVHKGPSLLGHEAVTGTVTVVSVTPSVAIEMVDITTSTRTFIADGLLTHNCYAREIATGPRARFYPAGFTPLFHPERLGAPANTAVPAAHRDDPAWWRVFVCSMADLYGRWVPDEWIRLVHEAMCASPQWQYITLTKFPGRYVGLDMPPGAWVGTSVDEQKRVRIAERAFRQIEGAAVRWLSLEPLLEPLEFTDLSMFDWIVIGAQTATRQPSGQVPAFAPPFEWVARIVAQARDAGCRVHLKPNLLGTVHPQSPGMVLPDEYPEPGPHPAVRP
jgi:protein gp37